MTSTPGDGLPTTVTFRDMAELVRAEIAGGYASVKQQGRRKLLDVIEELDADDGSGGVDLLAGRAWHLCSVDVRGVGGVARLEPARLDLRPHPGITVVRGQNGSGKTSIARALDCGLRGARDLENETAGDLWSADLLTEGVEEGTVETVLASGPHRLTIRSTVSGSGRPRIEATVHGPDATSPVELGGQWERELAAARASYSYSRLQARLRDRKNLQSYLEELLVLGPLWTRVRESISARSDSATAARKRLDQALQDARSGEAELRQRFEAGGRPADPPPAITWPNLRKDVPETWPDRHRRHPATGAPMIRVDEHIEQDATGFRAELSRAETDLSSAEETLAEPGTAAALDHLNGLLTNAELDETTCPLCGTVVDWRSHARPIVEAVRQRTGAAAVLTDVVDRVAAWAETTLAPLLPARSGGPDAEVAGLRAARAHGCRPHSSAHRAASDLLDVLDGAHARTWIGELRTASDLSAQWRAELARVVDRFLEVWRADGARAREADTWKKAEETLNELQVGLRQQRQDAVTRRIGDALRSLLPEAGVDLQRIEHRGGVKNQSGVSVSLTIGGRTAQLGMLSSGQRNALLLSPLLILDRPGAFGFLLIDDPVHALDDLRVDLLARELVRLGRERQVVVFTHDPRLEEHLRARRSDLQVVELDRDAVSRTVTWSNPRTPWDALLDDAAAVRSGAMSDGWADGAALESIVGGLCRAALDGAIRQAAINYGVRQNLGIQDVLRELDDQKETRRRAAHIVGLAGGPGSLPRTEQVLDEHLDDWNRATHGAGGGANLKHGLRAARKACTELAEFPW